jgi:ribosome modulation factor
VKTPLKVRQQANQLAANVYRAPGRDRDMTDLRNMRAEIREAYLAGWRDGVADAYRARYGFGPELLNGELSARDEAKLAKAAAERIAEETATDAANTAEET